MMYDMGNEMYAQLRDLYRNMETDELLSKAMDLLNRQGWTKGMFQGDGGTLCALGALNLAATGQAGMAPMVGNRHYDAWKEAYELVSQEIKRELLASPNWAYSAFELDQLMGSMSLIPTYNDHKGITGEDVTLVFKKALQNTEHDNDEESA